MAPSSAVSFTTVDPFVVRPTPPERRVSSQVRRASLWNTEEAQVALRQLVAQPQDEDEGEAEEEEEKEEHDDEQEEEKEKEG